tara:strand:+ start:580 stop:1035 length:456 start_codon:yes stop_codon:yes gene_type:complete
MGSSFETELLAKLTETQKKLANVLEAAGYRVQVGESEEGGKDEFAFLSVAALRVSDGSSISIQIYAEGNGFLLAPEKNMPIDDWSTLLIVLLGTKKDENVGSIRHAIPYTSENKEYLNEPLPQTEDGKLDFGKIKFNFKNLIKVLIQLGWK